MKKGMLDNDKNRMNYADGELVGGQKELDKNNDGDITGEDFAILREEREAKMIRKKPYRVVNYFGDPA